MEMEDSVAAGPAKRRRLLTGLERAVDLLKLRILRICTHASHGGTQYALGDAVCLHAETRTSSSTLKCLIARCAAPDLGDASPEGHVRSFHSAELQSAQAVDAQDALDSKTTAFDVLQDEYNDLDKRFIELKGKYRIAVEASPSAADIPPKEFATLAVPGLKQALSAMRTNATPEPEEDY